MAAWLPLVTIAASLLSKRDQERKAERASLEQTLNEIYQTRARELGASPYSGMVDDMVLRDSHRKQASNSAFNSIGTALQAYNGLTSGSKPEKFADERAGYEAFKDTDAIGALADKARTMSELYPDEYDRLDPWKRRR